jgi:hypothetical protein
MRQPDYYAVNLKVGENGPTIQVKSIIFKKHHRWLELLVTELEAYRLYLKLKRILC